MLVGVHVANQYCTVAPPGHRQMKLAAIYLVIYEAARQLGKWDLDP